MSNAHEPTSELRALVKLHAQVGTPQDLICRLIGISMPTLHKHYRDDLDLAMAEANATVASKLFDKILKGDTASIIFWLKTRAGWRETDKADPSFTIAINGAFDK